MVRSFFILALLFLSVPAEAKPLVADLSSHDIRIDSRFDGTQLLLFGARYEPGDIVVVMRGPARDAIIRKKDRIAGIWVNSEQYTLPQVPGFYSIAASRSLDSMRDNGQFAPLGVGLKHTAAITAGMPLHFFDAFGRIMQRQHLYAGETEKVSFMEDTLFKTFVNFPDNIPRGVYSAEVYLVSDGQLVGVQTVPIGVHKTGFDAWVYDMAHRQSVLYGLFAVIMALSVGWVASRVFVSI